jgi:hypothetical protein
MYIVILPQVCVEVKFCPSNLKEEQSRKLMVFENSGQRKLFVPTKEEIRGIQRKFHNEEHHNLYFSTNTIRMIKSRRKNGWDM